MKSTFKLIPFFLILVLCVYTACNKNHNASASQTDSVQSLSGQIALSLYKSLSVNYAGTKVNTSGKVLANIPSAHRSSLSSFAPYCGYTIDTAYVNTLIVADTTKTYGDHFKFVYTCTTGALDGYTVSDSVTNKETGALFANTFKNDQNYVVKALNTAYDLVYMVGTIGTTVHTSVINASHVTTQYHDLSNQYALNGVKIDFSSGTADITGTVTFSTIKTDFDKSVSANSSSAGYSGTITFLGNNSAKLYIQVNSNQYLYTVNLLTGALTAI